MSGSPDNLLTPGLFADPDPSNPEAARIIGSQALVRAAGNLLWRGARGVLGDVWENVIKPPGQILFGERTPYAGYANSLDPAAYAGRLAGYGMGVGNLLGGAGEGVARQFGAWHGTGSGPFREFSDEYLGTGQGAASYGAGHYVAGEKKVAQGYREEMGGIDPVPVNEEGFPLTNLEKLEKYYEPGSIVPGWAGFDRVVRFNKEPSEGGWPRWSVVVKKVTPDLSKDEAGIMGRMRGDNYDFMLGRPDLWKDIGGNRFHSTFPKRQDIADVGRVRGWKMGESGGLLHVNVVPEEDELLDWDLPWSKQDPEIREQMYKARLDPTSVSGNAGYGDAWAFRNDDPTGGEIYRQIAQNYYDREGHSDYGQLAASKDLDAAGIPGLKYKDAMSRGKVDQPTLKHNDDYTGAPDQAIVQQYLRDFPIYGRNLDEDIGIITNQLRVAGGDRIRDLDKFDAVLRQNLTPEEVDGLRQKSMSYHSMADWVEKEHKAGNFRVGSNLTRNYVIFDPKNLEIRTWNGRKLEPVDHDPFDVTRP